MAKTLKLSLLIGVAAALAGCVQQPKQIAQVAPPLAAKAPIAPPPARSRESALAAAAATAINPQVGGAAMLGTRTIADNCAAAPNLRTLTRAIGASEARQTLASAGPITVFAPTDQAFGRLASGAVDELLAPTNRPALAKVLTYHMVPGAITLDQLRARIDAAGGTARLPTIAGAPLTATREGAAIALTDASGNKSYVETPDVQQTNGIVHVINGVLVPQLG